VVDTRIGDHTASAQKLAGVGCKDEQGHVPIHHLQMVEKTAVDWDPIVLPGNATISNAKVREINVICIIRYCALLEQRRLVIYLLIYLFFVIYLDNCINKIVAIHLFFFLLYGFLFFFLEGGGGGFFN